MNILYDHQIFSIQPYGGVSRYFYEIAKHLSEMQDCEVEFFAPLHINQYLSLDSKARVKGSKIKKLPYSVPFIRSINSLLTKAMVSFRSDIDILHETYFTMVDYCPSHAKRVITVYDMIPEKLPQYFPNWKSSQKVKAHAVHRADHIICISENTRRDLVTLLNIPEGKTSVTHLGYSLSCPADTIEHINLEKPFLLYVGDRRGYKNFEMLLRAFASSQLLRNVFSIVCFGGGAPSHREIKMPECLGLPTDCVIYMGGDDKSLARLYASAKAFIYPSLYEGFGIPPLEAMALGCPTVCANTGSIPEVVGDAARLFDAKSEADLQAAIEQVVSSSEYAAQLRRKGLERIKTFSWRKCADETLRIYKNIFC